MSVMVDIRSVRKSFGPLEVLKGIDLRVRAGGVTAVLGPSGSGKSTLLRTINHLEKVGQGALRVASAAQAARRCGSNSAVRRRGSGVTPTPCASSRACWSIWETASTRPPRDTAVAAPPRPTARGPRCRGGPVDLAELIGTWHANGIVDGFHFALFEHRDLERLVNKTVALLQHRGPFRTFCPGGTLREDLGLAGARTAGTRSSFNA
ncbi:ATP-binding cassette domain-containing protein [Streptomyces sp. NPDC048419]|uniref:ATP-binding cassette domain-containing protein n=1 Tax=Streptomyces sp. NPDC048419 TaxID=3365547 RepID=UPI003721CE1F